LAPRNSNSMSGSIRSQAGSFIHNVADRD
jgi:hypothetical protein